MKSEGIPQAPLVKDEQVNQVRELGTLLKPAEEERGRHPGGGRTFKASHLRAPSRSCQTPAAGCWKKIWPPGATQLPSSLCLLSAEGQTTPDPTDWAPGQSAIQKTKDLLRSHLPNGAWVIQLGKRTEQVGKEGHFSSSLNK